MLARTNSLDKLSILNNLQINLAYIMHLYSCDSLEIPQHDASWEELCFTSGLLRKLNETFKSPGIDYIYDYDGWIDELFQEVYGDLSKFCSTNYSATKNNSILPGN